MSARPCRHHQEAMQDASIFMLQPLRPSHNPTKSSTVDNYMTAEMFLTLSE
jgi:hypothetical protein